MVNFAAASHIAPSITEPDIFIKSNVLGIQIFLGIAKANNLKKYLKVSTDEVYDS
ncbi:GDP-mannose 4,6-dehydratase [Priestia sp. Y58]|nr:GDP-mannose 4,6-dehydratase [Priestia sp. Y58]MDG0030625.1 GDP-mannose 4,6-dehydratase [Priestia sp. Y58]